MPNGLQIDRHKFLFHIVPEMSRDINDSEPCETVQAILIMPRIRKTHIPLSVELQRQISGSNIKLNAPDFRKCMLIADECLKPEPIYEKH